MLCETEIEHELLLLTSLIFLYFCHDAFTEKDGQNRFSYIITILWQFTRCGEFYGTSLDVEKGLMCLSIEWKLYTCRILTGNSWEKFISCKVLRQESNLATPVRCRCTALTTKLRR